MREQFEKLPEIAERIKRSNASYCSKGNWYLSPYEDCMEDEAFLDGAWYTYQEQQKKIDSVLHYLSCAINPLDVEVIDIEELLK